MVRHKNSNILNNNISCSIKRRRVKGRYIKQRSTSIQPRYGDDLGRDLQEHQASTDKNNSKQEVGINSDINQNSLQQQQEYTPLSNTNATHIKQKKTTQKCDITQDFVSFTVHIVSREQDKYKHVQTDAIHQKQCIMNKQQLPHPNKVTNNSIVQSCHQPQYEQTDNNKCINNSRIAQQHIDASISMFIKQQQISDMNSSSINGIADHNYDDNNSLLSVIKQITEQQYLMVSKNKPINNNHNNGNTPKQSQIRYAINNGGNPSLLLQYRYEEYNYRYISGVKQQQQQSDGRYNSCITIEQPHHQQQHQHQHQSTIPVIRQSPIHNLNSIGDNSTIDPINDHPNYYRCPKQLTKITLSTQQHQIIHKIQCLTQQILNRMHTTQILKYFEDLIHKHIITKFIPQPIDDVGIKLLSSGKFVIAYYQTLLRGQNNPFLIERILDIVDEKLCVVMDREYVWKVRRANQKRKSKVMQLYIDCYINDNNSVCNYSVCNISVCNNSVCNKSLNKSLNKSCIYSKDDANSCDPDNHNNKGSTATRQKNKVVSRGSQSRQVRQKKSVKR